MQRFFNYLTEARMELSKVTWPTRAQAIRLSLAVVVFSIVVAAFIGGVDYLLGLLVRKLILKNG